MVKSRNWQSKSNNIPTKTVYLFGATILIVATIFAICYWINILTMLPSSIKIVERFSPPSALLPKTNDSITTAVKLEPSYEEKFRRTISSCTSNGKDCQQHVPTGIQSRQRIAVASPPGASSDAFTAALRRSLLRHYYDGNLTAMRTAMDLVNTSHVPPYGYGKTHGWTKIVRLVGRPVLLREVFDSVEWAVAQGGGAVGDGVREEVFRQVVRWHNRLSHVAAHTALFSFDFSGGEGGKIGEELLRLVTFLVAGPGEDGGGGAVNMERVRRVAEDMERDIMSLAFSKDSDAVFNAFFTERDVGVLQDVLTDEFRMSNNLTMWPCLSFWDVARKGDETGSKSSSIADISQTMAESLVPDCDSPFTKCTVKKDRCEQRHDILCK